MSRYPPDDHDYRRRPETVGHSSSSARRDTRDRDDRDHREPTRNRRTEDRDSRMTDVVEDRIDPRIDPRMNARVDPIRTEPRPSNLAAPLRDSRPLEPRTMDPRSPDPDPGLLYQDPHTGEYYQYRTVPGRSPYPADNQYVDSRPRPRVPVDTPMANDRDSSRPQYEDYFCPGDGIEREVIQHNICKYLGQDATCRPGQKNGRNGFWVKAYRPFTSAMEHDLREDTVKWQRDRERRARHGRPQGSYADMQAREETRRYHPDVEMEDDYDRPQRPRDLDPRVPSRRGPNPVTSTYPMDPGYTSQSTYSITSTQPGYSPPPQAYYGGPERDPRFPTDKSTPPMMARTSQGGYSQPPYPTSRSGPAVTSSIPAPYGDPRAASMRDTRADVMMGYPPQGYPDQSRSHRG